MPGLIELHTDHLEAHYVPRPKVFWDPIAAVVSYDGQLATSGITTVLDSLRVWREDGAEEVDGRAGVLAEAIASARDADLLRVLVQVIEAGHLAAQPLAFGSCQSPAGLPDSMPGAGPVLRVRAVAPAL